MAYGFNLFDPNYNTAQNSAFGGQNGWMSNPTQQLSFGSNNAGVALAPFGSNQANGGWDWGKIGSGINIGMQGLSALGGLWGAYQSNKLARDNFNFTKSVTNTNLDNQIKSYNTSLEDRARSRAVMEGQSPTETADWIERNRLQRSGG